jgi:very-short-patch-repair endonuclease
MKKHMEQYSLSLIPTARMLRKNMTDPERKLWSLLRGQQLGVKFRRKVPLNKYIVDFYSVKAKLVVGLDGSQHYTNLGISKDKERDIFFNRNGQKVLRFSNNDILENEDGVLQTIFDQVQVRSRK